MASATGNNPTNNPRMDLLHSSGDNQLLNGPSEPAPASLPSASQASAYTGSPSPAAASAPRPLAAAKAAEPVPEPTPAPRNAPKITNDPSGDPPKRVRSLAKVGIIVMVILILATAGVGAWWYLSHRSSTTSDASPTPKALEVGTLTNLTQTGDSKVIGIGKASSSRAVTFGFTLPTKANLGSAIPEIELRTADSAFTGEPTATGDAVKSNGKDLTLQVSAKDLADGSYHWQARVKVGDKTGDWVVFGDDATAASLLVDATAPAAPVVGTADGSTVKDGKVSVTKSQPVFNGTAEPNATITLVVNPAGTKISAVADGSGKWSVAATTDIPSGQDQISVTATDEAGNVSTATALSVSVGVAAATPPTPAPTPTPTPAPVATTTPTPAPSTPTTLAPTGDGTLAISLGSLLVMVVSAIGWARTRRRYAKP